MKDRFKVDVSIGAQSSLEAHAALSLIDSSKCHHHSKNLRLPMGIYNVSVTRICDKLVKLCKKLEEYSRASNNLNELHNQKDIRKEMIDYIELSLYAAAEHVDDIDLIATGFYKNKNEYKNTDAFRKLESDIKRHKKFISSSANAIKHQQSRIRLYSQEFFHGGINSCLHGYFIEGVENGVVCPSSLFHSTQQVFSITTLIWEILIFLSYCSRSLHAFIISSPRLIVGPASVKAEGFSSAVLAAAKLPIYTFGETHPFSKATFVVTSSDEVITSTDSEIYGSIFNRWKDDRKATFGQAASEFEGDGITTQFRFAKPSEISLQHWQ